MAGSPANGPLPDYANPPVVETILGVQFEPLPDFRNAHLGAFWKTLNQNEWPKVADAPPLESQVERFSEQMEWGRMAFQFKLAQDMPNRLQVSNKDGDRMIQVQNGRLHFNWLGKAGGPYPHYGPVRDGFDWLLGQFSDYIAREKLGDLRPNQWEVTYLNHIPKGTVWKTVADWHFFSPLGAVPSVSELIEAESFGGEWHYIIPEKRGRLHVRWQHSQRQEPKLEEIIVLNLTARGPVEDEKAGLTAALTGLDLGHDVIVRSFKDFMSKDASDYWGLKNAQD